MTYQRVTIDWLKGFGLYGSYDDLLFMRKENDFRPDFEVKEEMLGILRQLNIHPDLAIDDKQSVVDMWRRNGVVTLQNSMKELT